MDEAGKDRVPVLSTRNRDQSVVMISLDGYEELEETAHLIRSPGNARRLLTAIHLLESGNGKPQKLLPIARD